MPRGLAPPLRTTRVAVARRCRTLTGVAFAVGTAAAGCGGTREAQPEGVEDEVEDEAPLGDRATHAAVGPATTGDRARAASPRLEHPGFALGDNFLTAHRVVGGDLLIDAGSIGFARYTHLDRPTPRWQRGRVAAGRRVAVARKGGALEVPLTAAQAAAASGLAMRVVATEAGEVRVRVGGGRPSAIAIVPGRHWYPVTTAPGAWRVGDNLIGLEGPVALEQLRVTADPLAALADDEPTARATWSSGTRTLALDRDAGLAWYLQLPPAAALVARVADPACTIDVTAIADDGATVHGVLGGDRDRVELAPAGDRAVRLELVARGCARAELADPVLTIPGAAPAAAPHGPPPRYVVLWVFDALRADRVRPFQPGARAEVPNFEALATTGAVFRQYYVGGNESQVSHATLWTSSYPAVHDVRPVGVGGSWRLPSRLPVLGELVAAGGLTPIAVTGNGFVLGEGGYGRGFAEYRNMMREKGIINGVLYGAEILAHALRRLEALQPSPTFLFMGTIDTHGPWIARQPWIDRYSPGYHGPFQYFGTARELGIVQGKMGCSKIPAQREIDRLRAIYDSAISYHDARLGDLVAALKRMGIYDQTMIILTADHGEELFEDGRCGHGGSQRESLLRVPLLIHYPPRIAAGVVDVGAEGVDVLPTILDALDAPVPAGLQGESLAALAAGVGAGWPRPSYATQFEYAHTMRIGRWKLKAGMRGAPRLVDLIADPDERVDVAAAHPIARRAMIDALGLFLATRERWHKRPMGVVTNLAPGAAALLEDVP